MTMNAAEIASIIANDKGNVFYGVRADQRKYNVGDEMPASYLWDFANDCSSNLQADGTSTIGIDFAGDIDDDDAEKVQAALDKVSRYGGTVYLVAGRHAGHGDADDGEVLIDGAIVIAIAAAEKNY
jgi:polygalacturonase